MHIEPPHQAHERDKLAGMLRALRAGETLPPVLVHAGQAYSGSHRIEAWSRLEMEVDYVEISDEDYDAIMIESNLDTVNDCVYDFEMFLGNAQYLGLAGEAK